MTEDQKYQGALYKEKNKKTNNQPAPTSTPTLATSADDKAVAEETSEKPAKKSKTMAHHAYVEDFEETWRDYQGPTDDEKSPAELMPEAPTPPSAVPEDHVNVFDFLVAAGQTPNASKLDLPTDDKALDAGESTSLVRYEYKSDDYLDPTSLMDDEEPLVEYGKRSLTTGPFETPAPSKSERRKSKESEARKDKKRKRLHVDVPGDQVMTDAPPVLHSGLTGGLKTMMRPTLPPSPDYSGADNADALPTSPLKKTKHSKSKSGQTSNSLFGIISGSTKSKKKSSKSSKKHSSRRRDKSPKLIEYRPHSKDGKAEDGQMVVFKPRADLFMGFVNKGPESERGCSMNKALKRFHRERQAAGTDLSKHMEEKELWRSIRMRRNDRGEIVLFSV
jgi:cell growth-regulating nucleolar protein